MLRPCVLEHPVARRELFKDPTRPCSHISSQIIHCQTVFSDNFLFWEFNRLIFFELLFAEMDEVGYVQPHTLPLWSYRRVLTICALLAFGGFQYGFDNSAISGMQAMEGFLAVFGYEDPESPLGWNISVSFPLLLSKFVADIFSLAKSATAYLVLHVTWCPSWISCFRSHWPYIRTKGWYLGWHPHFIHFHFYHDWYYRHWCNLLCPYRHWNLQRYHYLTPSH